MKSFFKLISLVALAMIIAPISAFAQNHLNAMEELEKTDIPLKSEWNIYAFYLDFPNQVQRYRIECSDSTTLTIRVADVGISGDKWKAKAYIYDKYATSKTATASGVKDVFSPATIMSNSGKVPLRAFVEVRYSSGTNLFPASGLIYFETNGTCIPEITVLPIEEF